MEKPRSRSTGITSVSLIGAFLCLAALAHADTLSAQKQFRQLCQGCHGEGGAGGDRAPALVNNRDLRTRSESQIEDVIRHGAPGGMPAFALPEPQLLALAHWLRSLNSSAADAKPVGDVAAGRRFFFGQGQCSSCHMLHGSGNANGPDLSDIGKKSTVHEMELVLDNPTAQRGAHTTPTCPEWAFCPDESWSVVDVHLKNGSQLRGFSRNRGEHDLQLQTFDGKFHLLSDDDYLKITPEDRSYMPPLQATAVERRDLLAFLSTLSGTLIGAAAGNVSPVSPADVAATMQAKAGNWSTYNGDFSGNRFSSLNLINTGNVRHLALEWIYSLPAAVDLETTPLVMNGVMYVTGPGQVCALDGRHGRSIWCYTREVSPDAATGAHGVSRHDAGATEPNRGVALLGDRVFFTSADAHLICLNRLTGGVMWDVALATGPGRYSATSAPLVVGNLVISGIAGGDMPSLGFIAAYQAANGRQAWRFSTIPKPGEPGSQTWKGAAIATGGGATWLTGSYDRTSDTLFWTVGNPFPATDGDDRAGTNLYTNCVLALDAKTGKLRWYFQFTPHDLHDWDATEPVVLVDALFAGRPRQLLLQANRNGFFYVLDRTDGHLLLATPFVRKLNWASGIGPDGTPHLLAANKPTAAGVKTCPAVRGATNWYSTSFLPSTGLFYVMAAEDCSIYKQAHVAGYEGFRDPSDPGLRYLRALDISTGKIAWEIPQTGPQVANYSGVLSTAGNLVFFGETGGGFSVADAKTGKLLWTFKANQPWKASPMTYVVNGRQYVSTASGGNILTFALADH